MIFSYYPGCTLKNKAQELDQLRARIGGKAGRNAAGAGKLAVLRRRLSPWRKDEIATKLASVRALNAAQGRGQDLVTLCSACHNVLKQANDAMANDAEFSDQGQQLHAAGDSPTTARRRSSTIWSCCGTSWALTMSKRRS